MPTNPGVSEVQDKNGVVADIEAKRFDGTRTVQIQGDVTATQTWNGDSNTALTLNASIGAKKVTQDKIADKAVGSGQMDDGSVGFDQIDPNVYTNTVEENNTKLVTSGGVNSAIQNAILNRGRDYGPKTVDEINALSNIPTGSTVHVSALGSGDARVVNDGWKDGQHVSIQVRVGEDLTYYISGNDHGWYSNDGEFKLKQQEYSASGLGALKTITSLSQDENGVITAVASNIQSASTSQAGVVQLNDTTNSTSTTQAATANSVKSAYDLANTANTGLANKLDKTGDGKDVTATFTEASSRENIGTGEKLSVMFGKIKKWFSDLKALAFKDTVSDSDISGTISDSHIASASTWNGKADKVSGATNGNFAALDSNGNLTDSGKKASDFELVTNKVSSWQTTPDNTHYPSEKLVKDGLDAKADADNAVAIYDGYMRRMNETTGWRKLAYKTVTATNVNFNSTFRLYLIGSNNEHVGLGDLVVNIRLDGTGHVPECRTNELRFYKSFSVTCKIKVTATSDNAVIEIWFRPITFSLLMISCLGNGLDVTIRNKDWSFGQYIDATDPEPVEDTANGVYVFNSTKKYVQYDIASPTNGNLVSMDANGLVKDSGVAVLPSTSTWDGTSDAKVPTAKAVQAKLDGKQDSLAFMTDSEAVAIWADAKTAAANAS